MFNKFWGSWIVCLAGTLGLQLPAGAAVTIGIVLPQGRTVQSTPMAESLRQSLIIGLKLQSVEAVALSATEENAADAEAQAKHCTHILYSRVQPNATGLRGRFAAFKSSLPFGGSGQKPEAAPGSSASLGEAAQVDVKYGDAVQLDYRLVTVGTASPIKSDTLISAKASRDGEDIVSPMIPQVVSAVATQDTSVPAAAASAKTSAGPSASSHFSLGGLFSNRSIASSKPATQSASNTMDCAKLAAMPNAPMSLDACQKFQTAQNTYTQAASDPSAMRDGDQQMSCMQITAELKQQSYTRPDATKVAEATATAGEAQSINQKEYANLLKLKAKDQAATTAATATDTATAVATGGLVQGRAQQAADKAMRAEHDANNERIMKEDMPTYSKLTGQTADFGADFASQLKENPRLARLMQLAQAKHCNGGS